MWLIVAILFILFFVLYPYVVRVPARRRMLRSLCRVVHQNGGKIRVLKKSPSLSGNFSRKPDVWVGCGQVQYMVKLWTPKDSRADLRIRFDGKVREARNVRAPLAPHKENRTYRVLAPWRSLPMPMGKKSSGAKQSARRVSILLVSPPYARMLRQEERGWRELGGGDRVGDWFLHTPASFAALLHDHSPRADATSIEQNQEKQTQSVF